MNENYNFQMTNEIYVKLFCMNFDEIKASDFFPQIYNDEKDKFKRVGGEEKRKNCIIASLQIKTIMTEQLNELADYLKDENADVNVQRNIVRAFQLLRQLNLGEWLIFDEYRDKILTYTFKGLPLSDYDYLELIEAYCYIARDAYKTMKEKMFEVIDNEDTYPKYVAEKIIEYIKNK